MRFLYDLRNGCCEVEPEELNRGGSNTKKVKKVFISQPMKGKTDEEILATRDMAMTTVTKRIGEPVLILDSFIQGAPGTKPLWYLGESLKVLSEADVAFFARGWRTARGCAIEHLCADEYGVEIIEEEQT